MCVDTANLIHIRLKQVCNQKETSVGTELTCLLQKDGNISSLSCFVSHLLVCMQVQCVLHYLGSSMLNNT